MSSGVSSASSQSDEVPKSDPGRRVERSQPRRQRKSRIAPVSAKAMIATEKLGALPPTITAAIRATTSAEPGLDLHRMWCDLAERLMHQGKVLPHWLLQYVIKAARKGQPSKRPGPDNHLRDVAIVMAVENVCRWTGLPRSRNDATDGPSGCSIVSEALGRLGHRISAKRIARIYRERTRHHPLPE